MIHNEMHHYIHELETLKEETRELLEFMGTGKVDEAMWKLFRGRLERSCTRVESSVAALKEKLNRDE